MDGTDPGQATLLLQQWKGGDAVAKEQLISLLHGEMRSIARRLMRKERAGHTLQPTAVVSEACIRLLGNALSPAANRGEFLGLAARVMRQVLVDHARKRDSSKRGGDWQRVSLVESSDVAELNAGLVDALDLDSALTKLTELSPRQAQVAEMRYFAGMTVPETAEALGVSAGTVKNEWTVARLWLKRELGGGGDPEA